MAVLAKSVPQESLGQKPDFQMPRPYLGEIVYWYRDASKSHPFVAVVIAIYDRSVRVMLLDPTAPRAMISSTRHMEDPSLENRNLKADGGWDFSDERKDRDRRAKLWSERMATLERPHKEAKQSPDVVK